MPRCVIIGGSRLLEECRVAEGNPDFSFDLNPSEEVLERIRAIEQNRGETFKKLPTIFLD